MISSCCIVVVAASVDVAVMNVGWVFVIAKVEVVSPIVPDGRVVVSATIVVVV